MIGRMRHELILQSPNPQTNDYGENIPGSEWDDVATIWCSIEPLRGREMEMAKQVNASITHELVMRNMIGITDRTLSTFRLLDTRRNIAFNIIQHLSDFYTQDTFIRMLCIQDEHPT